jgi:hypothetical protein
MHSLSLNASRRRVLVRIAGTAALAVHVLLVPAPARAANYTGYGETDWGYDNKSYCCEDALQAAQDDSARSCEAAGGYPSIRSNSVRGRCDWEASRGRDGRRIYRCTATASVSCR